MINGIICSTTIVFMSNKVESRVVSLNTRSHALFLELCHADVVSERYWRHSRIDMGVEMNRCIIGSMIQIVCSRLESVYLE